VENWRLEIGDCREGGCVSGASTRRRWVRESCLTFWGFRCQVSSGAKRHGARGAHVRFQVLCLLYEEWTVPALECGCRNSGCIFHVRDHLLHLFICIDRYQVYVWVLVRKYAEDLIGEHQRNLRMASHGFRCYRYSAVIYPPMCDISTLGRAIVFSERSSE
jgi:hypothetical protein